MTKDYQPNQAVLFEEESDQESLPSLAEDEDEEETRPPPYLFPAIFYFRPTLGVCIPHFDHRTRQWVLVPLRSFGQQSRRMIADDTTSTYTGKDRESAD